jgi:hypothetical protein
MLTVKRMNLLFLKSMKELMRKTYIQLKQVFT